MSHHVSSQPVWADYDLFIVDLDGVVYLGTEAIPSAVAALAALERRGAAIVYATNNASRRASEVAQLLRSLGIAARDDQVLTSAAAAAGVLAGQIPARSTVLVVGAPALREEVAEAGLVATDKADDRPAAVVQGYGPGVGWAHLAQACLAVRAGASWVVTNTDATLPSPHGPLPGNGSLVAALSTALAGKAPDLVVGKPSPLLFEQAVTRTGARRALVIGDRLDTDIAGANRAGLDSLLVLTGVATASDAARATVHERPTFVCDDLGILSELD